MSNEWAEAVAASADGCKRGCVAARPGGGIALVEQYVPVLSLGVLYIFAVLPVAVIVGLGSAFPVSVASMLAGTGSSFRPGTRSHLQTARTGSRWRCIWRLRSWVSELAARARCARARHRTARERESALLAGLATERLGGRRLAEEVGEIANRGTTVLGVEHAEDATRLGRPKPRRALPSCLEAARAGASAPSTPRPASSRDRLSRRFLPALAALLRRRRRAGEARRRGSRGRGGAAE